jgi:hypothetical protein
MVQKNIDIIPIRYMSGTGGQFLSNFITAAKNKNNYLMDLSKHGNAHSTNLLDFSFSETVDFAPQADDSFKISSILSLIKQDDSIPAYYPAMHIRDIGLLLDIFNKTISIWYEPDDVNDIAIVFYGKYYMDQEYCSNITTHKYVTIKLTTHQRLSTFNQYDSSSVLNLSWKEMLYKDPNNMINKISSFTSIPKDNFNVANLLKWRETTMQCLSTISRTLNTIQETNKWLIAHK